MSDAASRTGLSLAEAELKRVVGLGVRRASVAGPVRAGSTWVGGAGMEDAAVSRTVELIFGVLDADGNGTIDGQELLGMIAAINFKPSPSLMQFLTEHW